MNSSTGGKQTRFYGSHLFFFSWTLLLLLLQLILFSSGLFRIGSKNMSMKNLSHVRLLASSEEAQEEAEEAAEAAEAAEAEETADAVVTEDEAQPEGLTIGKLRPILLWVDVGLIVFLLLHLIQLIPWNRFYDVLAGLAGIAAAVLTALILFGSRLTVGFMGVIWGAFGILAGIFALAGCVYLWLRPVTKLRECDDLEFLALSRWQKRCYKIGSRYAGIPKALLGILFSIGRFFKNLWLKIVAEFKDIYVTFREGDWKTRTSFFVMGFGSIARGQILRGLLFLLFELVFIAYMFLVGPLVSGLRGGSYWIWKLMSLGTRGPENRYNEALDAYYTVYHDNSFQILLYGVLTIFFIIAFIYTWRQNVRQNRISQQILATGKPLRSGKDDLHSLVDDNFHRTLLALPMTGILIFTVMPIVFMILVAFTSYDGTHDGYNNSLFQWVGLANFNEMLSWSGGNKTYSATFGQILTWTLIWAFFATFTNYFLGMFVAMMINKKGIQFKKLWRTVLVLTIAIPQFISLLYVAKMFAKNGIINEMLLNLHIIDNAIDFLGNSDNSGLLPRIMVIVINIWIGIPYLMLVATGILMNIPADLYESAKIDGASGWKQYTKITLPYMLFITGPYLLTSFTGNMNNFNVIYLLTGGRPSMESTASGAPGYTDLLVTWLFKITDGEGARYNTASVIGILVFAVVALISLVVYGLLPSIKNEEDFQ